MVAQAAWDVITSYSIHYTKLYEILEAEGVKQSQILQAEGIRQSEILRAEGDAQARILRATAEAKAIELVSNAAEQFFKERAEVSKRLDA